MSDTPRRTSFVLPAGIAEVIKGFSSMTLSPELRESILQTQNLISRVPPTLEPLKIAIPPNPVFRTNAILEGLSEDIGRMVANTEQQAEIIKSLAQTANLALAESASSAADAKRATNLTKFGVWIAIATVIVSAAISVWGILDARHNGDGSDKRLEVLTAAIADLSRIEEKNGVSTAEQLKALAESQHQQLTHSTSEMTPMKQRLIKP